MSDWDEEILDCPECGARKSMVCGECVLCGYPRHFLRARGMRALGAVILALALAGCAKPAPPPAEEFTPRELRELLCSDEARVGGKSVSIEVSSFPCSALKTRLAIEDSYGRGFWSGAVTRGFLRARLVARGFGSMILGLVGLG